MLLLKLNNDLTAPWQAVFSLPKWVYFCCNKNIEMKRAAHRKWKSTLPSRMTVRSAGSVTTPITWASRGPASTSCPFSHKIALLHKWLASQMMSSSPVFDSSPMQQPFQPPSKVTNKCTCVTLDHGLEFKHGLRQQSSS